MSGRIESFIVAFTVVAVGIFCAAPLLAGRTVDQTWVDEYQELSRQIKRFQTLQPAWRNRLAAEALDRQALILPEDRDPLDVGLRRMAALVQYYNQHQMIAPASTAGIHCGMEATRGRCQSHIRPAGAGRAISSGVYFTTSHRLRESIAEL